MSTLPVLPSISMNPDVSISTYRPSAVAPPTQRVDFAEIGTSGIKRFSGVVLEEFLTNLQGLKGVRVYREMGDNDSIVGASLYAIEQVIKKASWFVEPAGTENIHREAADFLKTCMNDMSHSWLDFIAEAITCLQYGWAWHELVYKIRKGQSNNPSTNSKHNDGLIGWRKIPLRLQHSWFDWKFDESGGVQAFVQCAPPDYAIREIPIDKSLLFRAKNIGNNPEGRSILRSAYRAWYFKKSIEEIEAIGIERDLVGLPVFTPPEGYDINATENRAVKVQIKKLIANLRRDEQEGILLPDGWDIKLLSLGVSRRQFDVDRIINRYDKRITATVLAQFIMLGMDRVGSFALSKNQNDLFLVAVQGHLDSLAEVINSYAIPRLFQLNPKFRQLSEEATFPRAVAGKVSEPSLTEVAQYVSALAKGGFLLADTDIIRDLKRIGGFSEKSDRKVEGAEEDDPEAMMEEEELVERLREKQLQLLGGGPKASDQGSGEDGEDIEDNEDIEDEEDSKNPKKGKNKGSKANPKRKGNNRNTKDEGED